MGMFAKTAAVVFLFLFALSYAENYVAINSNDGRDVLSGISYANVKGMPVRFMPTGGSSETFAAKVGSDHEILLIQSSTTPISGLVESALRANNNQMEIYSSVNGGAANLELARRSGASQFIVVDSAFSDSAISVMTYAALTKSYVLFADGTNADQVAGIVSGKKVIVYGYVDSKVKSALTSSNPVYVGKGTDKYADNVEITKKTMDEYPLLTRPIMTDGTVLEDAMAAGTAPILLTGRLVPQVTYDFVKQEAKDGKLTGVLLIGDSLVYPVYDMRERIKRELAAEGINKSIGVMVKFAQAIPSQGNAVMGLDMFRVPAYKPILTVNEIVYNKENKKLMIGLENAGEGPLYYTIEAKVQVNGADYRVFGSTNSKLIERGASDGAQYDLDLSSVPEGSVTASVIVKFGAAQNSLEEFVAQDGKLTTIQYSDNTNVSVQFAKYEKDGQRLLVTIKNNGADAAYVFTKITLNDESGASVKISAPGIKEVGPRSLYIEEFPLILSDKEIVLNKEIPVSIDYGGRRGFLLKNALYVVPLEQAAQQQNQLQPILIGALAAVVVLLVLYGIYRLIALIRKK
ncbi:MAG: hypothetical protein NTV88_04810 [Candidatus Micrarchaeota archaeon]|nr:hypothetical protein [Candidatus Micrarchaeota archaeon]